MKVIIGVIALDIAVNIILRGHITVFWIAVACSALNIAYVLLSESRR